MKRLKLKIKSGFADPAQESKSLTDAVRQAIEAENDAICQYRQYAALAKEQGNKEAEELFIEISQDERVHAQQLTDFLSYIDPMQADAIKKAKEEDAEKQRASAPAITVREAALGDAQPEVIDLNQQDYEDFVQDKAENNPNDYASED